MLFVRILSLVVETRMGHFFQDKQFYFNPKSRDICRFGAMLVDRATDRL